MTLARTLAAAVPLAFVAPAAAQDPPPPPILDVHLHAAGANSNGPAPTAICPGAPDLPVALTGAAWQSGFLDSLKKPVCDDPIWGPATDREVLEQTLAILRRRNVYAITSGPPALLDEWQKAGGGRIIPALGFSFSRGSVPGPAEVHRLLKDGRYAVFGEVGIQYQGISPDDPVFEPYLAVAEELDVPVGIHVGTGPPGAPYIDGLGRYRARLHSPLLIEEALVRHPKLRVYLMHAGWPMLDDLLALLWTHPQVHVDVGVISYALPRSAFHRYLEAIVAAGFAPRVMFGSDQMNWPGAVEVALAAVESAPFLSPEQKRAILFDNAARFLRLPPDRVAAMQAGR
jgi:predicted TIM-barrel fold metal-dependent hydrolase